MTDTASTTSAKSPTIQQRKGRHLQVCVDPDQAIESQHTYFQEVRLIHNPLPELDWDDLDTSITFLNETTTLPFFISCMTGGSEAGARANRHLVQAAQQTGIPVGLGSMRVLLRNPDLWSHFHMKPLAPDVPVWANLGVSQLRDIKLPDLVEILKRLEVQALVLHCNPGQEQFQSQGDRHFSGILAHIHKLCTCSPIPIMVKETGFGMRPQDALQLKEIGVAAVDLAGSGGTNWVLVESQCHPEVNPKVALDFRTWGNPTPLVLAALDQTDLPILASGGIRSGADIAKSLALGASLAGLALPFVQADDKAGVEGVIAYIETLTQSLKTTMLLTGSRTVAQLQRCPLTLSESFISLARQYRHPENWRTLIHGIHEA